MLYAILFSLLINGFANTAPFCNVNLALCTLGGFCKMAWAGERQAGYHRCSDYECPDYAARKDFHWALQFDVEVMARVSSVDRKFYVEGLVFDISPKLPMTPCLPGSVYFACRNAGEGLAGARPKQNLWRLTT